MDQKETVSVILPTYNRASLITRAIGSVLDQTWQDFELIIVDDGSTDDTEKTVAGFTDDRIRYVRLAQNGGPSMARNRGIELAKGEYIAFQDSDDEWMSDKLEKQMELMLGSTGELGLVYCRMERNYKNGARQIYPSVEKAGTELQGNLFVPLLEHNYIGTPTMLVRKECIVQSGGFDEKLRGLEDWELVLRLAESWDIGFVDETLIKVYVTEKSVSMDAKSYVETRCYMIAKYWKVMSQNNLLNDIIRSVLMTAKKHGYYEEAKQLVGAALHL